MFQDSAPCTNILETVIVFVCTLVFIVLRLPSSLGGLSHPRSCFFFLVIALKPRNVNSSIVSSILDEDGFLLFIVNFSIFSVLIFDIIPLSTILTGHEDLHFADVIAM